MRPAILQELDRDLLEFERHRLDPPDRTLLHRLYLELVDYMRTEPPWSTRDFVALVEYADRRASAIDDKYEADRRHRVAPR